jgi:hypothetical protein
MEAHSQEQVTDPADPLVEELAERQFQWRVRHRYPDESAGRAAARELVLAAALAADPDAGRLRVARPRR